MIKYISSGFFPTTACNAVVSSSVVAKIGRISHFNQSRQQYSLHVYKQGAVVGVIVALPLSLWIGLGSILNRPPLPAPERSVSGCPLANITDNNNNNTVYSPDITTWRENPADLLTYVTPTTGTPAANKKFWSSPDYKE